MTAMLDTIPLDDAMTWQNEHGWTPVRERVAPSVTGKAIVTHATLQYGRSVVLNRGDAGMWLSRATVAALEALRDTGGWTGVLVLADARTMTVRWDHAAGPIEVEPIWLVSDPGAADKLRVTLRLMEISL